jgi:hypothetical protein
MDLPSRVGQSAGGRVAVEVLAHGSGEPAEADVDAAVVVDSDEIMRGREIVQMRAHAALARKGPVQPPGRDRLQERQVVQPLALPCQAPVERAVAPVRSELEHVVRDSDAAARALGSDGGGRLGVGAEHVLQGSCGGCEARAPRRDLPAQVSAQEKDDRLVEGDPKPNARPQGIGHDLGVPAESGDALRILPPAV